MMMSSFHLQLKSAKLTTEKRALPVLKRQILNAINKTRISPAKFNVPAPLSSDVVELLKEWARGYDYVLNYKEKVKRVEDIPDDIRNEGRDVTFHTIKVYW
jgi:hypothetical protein